PRARDFPTEAGDDVAIAATGDDLRLVVQLDLGNQEPRVAPRGLVFVASVRLTSHPCRLVALRAARGRVAERGGTLRAPSQLRRPERRRDFETACGVTHQHFENGRPGDERFEVAIASGLVGGLVS